MTHPLGAVVRTCAVHDEKGRHCDRPPAYAVRLNGEDLELCETCYENACNGVYGDVSVLLNEPRENPPENPPEGVRLSSAS